MTQRHSDDRGFIMVAMLISMAVAAIWLTALLPAWRQQAIREKEAELVFRGEQYARAIVFYQQKNQGLLPPNIDLLVSQKHLRKKYKDPMTGQDFGLMIAGTVVNPATSMAPMGTPPSQQGSQMLGGGGNQPPGIQGVRSMSSATSIRIYYGQQAYNLWQFDGANMRGRMGLPLPGQQPGAGRPGQPGQPGRGGPGGRDGGPGVRPGGPGRADVPAGPGRGGPPPPPGRGRGN
jgi:type II secretory pathway pseudopilin PulG